MQIAFEAKDLRIIGVAQSCSSFRHRVEHWLDIGVRTGDHSQNLTRRRLLLQGLSKFGACGLQPCAPGWRRILGAGWSSC